jgi:hypothetical protein
MKIRGAPLQTYQDSKKLAIEKNNEILYFEYKSDSQNLTYIHVTGKTDQNLLLFTQKKI